jgi:hypothetical protein
LLAEWRSMDSSINSILKEYGHATSRTVSASR